MTSTTINATLGIAISTATLQNSKAGRKVHASFGRAMDKPYSIEARLMSAVHRKTVEYQPFLAVKTPTSELVELGGSVMYAVGKLLSVDMALDKAVAKPVKLRGE
jgi:hypothetical protein